MQGFSKKKSKYDLPYTMKPKNKNINDSKFQFNLGSLVSTPKRKLLTYVTFFSIFAYCFFTALRAKKMDDDFDFDIDLSGLGASSNSRNDQLIDSLNIDESSGSKIRNNHEETLDDLDTDDGELNIYFNDKFQDQDKRDDKELDNDFENIEIAKKIKNSKDINKNNDFDNNLEKLLDAADAEKESGDHKKNTVKGEKVHPAQADEISKGKVKPKKNIAGSNKKPINEDIIKKGKTDDKIQEKKNTVKFDPVNEEELDKLVNEMEDAESNRIKNSHRVNGFKGEDVNHQVHPN